MFSWLKKILLIDYLMQLKNPKKIQEVFYNKVYKSLLPNIVMFSKRGSTVAKVILGIFILFIVIVIGIAGYNASNGSDFGSALTDSIDKVSGYSMTILGPLFNTLLGSGGDANLNFLRILTFILISIIIVGTLDSVNIFGDDKNAKLANFAIGIIVAIIGVRFMPKDMWLSLTAPSSAFVATILVGTPFAALFFVTMKIQFNLARKLLWLFYMIFLSYLIFFSEVSSNAFAWIYIIFLVLAGIMLFFDGTLQKIWRKGKADRQVVDVIEKLNSVQRYNLRRKIEDYDKIIGDNTASKKERDDAKKEIKELREMYGDLSAI